jgi:hypothetical protein
VPISAGDVNRCVGPGLCVLPLRQLPILLPRWQFKRPLPGLVIHLVGVDLLTARAAAVDGPRTSLNLYVLGVAFVCLEERFYGRLLSAFFYHMVVVHEDGRLPSAFGYFGGAIPEKEGMLWLLCVTG